MRIPTFLKTMRFRLTLWYSGILIVLLMVLLVGINVAMAGSRTSVSDFPPRFPGDVESWRDTIAEERDRNLADLRNYSLMGVGIVLVVGAVGGYILSGMMLRPIDRVSSLAARISYTNLKERINHEGPEDELKRLADTFDDMLQRLDFAVESQKQFIQDASHELRTPIATAQTNIEVVEMDDGATVADYRRLTGIIKRSLDRLSYLSQGLLLLSQGDQPQTRAVEVDLMSVVEEAAGEAQRSATARGVELKMGPGVGGALVRGDAVRMKQAISNLIDNAIKYNRPQGTVRVSVRVEGSEAIVEVVDTGIGIAKSEQSQIFERFYRADKSRSRASGGSGLGLAIVKRIVEEHGGKVSVESTPGEGSTFRLSLPRHT